jgi:hypothetical protein
MDRENVYLEGIDRFQGLLPTLLLERNLAFLFFSNVSQVDVQLRPVDQEITNHAGSEERAPVYPRAKTPDVGDRRIRIGILYHGQILEIQSERNGVEIGMTDVDRIAFQMTVHLMLHVPGQSRIADEI